MKKSLIVTLALVFVLGIAGTAFANPYSDVPAGHWAYKAVNDLTKAGVVEGYQGKYHGNDNMTRYEMAAITARAMAKADKADAATKATIDKLAVEFSKELNDLGVRVAKLEKNQSAIKITGESRLDYTWLDSADKGTDEFGWRQRLHLTAPVTDKITYNARLQAESTFGTEGKSNTRFTRNFFSIKDLLGIDTVNVGRLPVAVGRYTVVSQTNGHDGVTLKHKFGKFVVDGYHVDLLDKNLALKGANIDYNATKDFVFNAGYAATEKADYVDVGLSYVFNPGVSLVAGYAQSDEAGDPSMYAAQLTYNWKSKKAQKGFYSWEKIVNPAIAHDQAIAVGYRNIEKLSHPGVSVPFGAVGTVAADNIKGYSVTYQNSVAKNVLLTLEYHDVEEETGTKEEKKAYASFEFFF